MSKFTPGPWHYTQFLSDPRLCLVWNEDSSRCIADVHNKPGTHGAVAEADARLIAAAPDLLEAAIALKDVCNRPSAARTRAYAWQALDKAIAKATKEAAKEAA